MPARVRCYLCGGQPREGRTCDPCRRMLASESICRSGDGCRSRAGYGVFGQFCEGHAAALASLRLGRGLDKSKPIPGAKPPPEPKGDALGRRPVAERAVELARLVHERGRLSRADAAAALDMSPGGSLGRAIRHAREAGWIDTQRGGARGGLYPASRPPAEHEAKAA